VSKSENTATGSKSNATSSTPATAAHKEKKEKRKSILGKILSKLK